MTKMEKRNEILDVSFEFALQTIEYSELFEEKKKYVIARQLLKSETSIGANIREAQGGESKADFVHNLKIAHKEAEETEYWILRCERAKTYPTPQGEMKALVTLHSKVIKQNHFSTKSNMKRS